jgi:hypothetical protein
MVGRIHQDKLTEGHVLHGPSDAADIPGMLRFDEHHADIVEGRWRSSIDGLIG